MIGLGLDLTEISRIESIANKYGDRFINRVFTPGEREFAYKRAHWGRHLAGRFAAKEATLKALCVPPGLSWHELEVVGGGSVQPVMKLSGKAELAAQALGIKRLIVSITHTNDVAAAVVVALGDE